MHKLVAIHQPNFFPWLGYFDKIRRADCFIFLDDAQFPKTGGVWSNRVKILQQGKARWLTAPIDRAYSGVRLIHEMRFSAAEDWRAKTVKTLHAAYGRATYFAATMALISPLIDGSDNDLAAYNMRAITTLAAALGLETRTLEKSSTLDCAASGTERLIALTRAVGGDAYLCGGGAEGYQEDALFAVAGVELVYQNFRCQPYPQSGAVEFVPGLSIIDALMHGGQDAVATWLRREAVEP
ncbi:MAG: WbqC family protein [Alphaproteobacteria bacterium]